MTRNEIKFNALKTNKEKRLFVLNLVQDKKFHIWKRLMEYKHISLSTVEIAFKVSQGIKVQHNKTFVYNNGIEKRKF